MRVKPSKNVILTLATTLAITVLANVGMDAQGPSIYYVRAGAAGAKSGTDWTNAYTDLPRVLERGSTYFVADGVYSAWTLDAAMNGGAFITIKKATTSSHGTETGWHPSYGDGQAVIQGSIGVRTSYWLIDGQTGGGPASWRSGYGFYVDRTRPSDGSGIAVGTDADHITIRHVEIRGHGDDGDAASQDGINSSSGNGPRTFSYIYIHDVGRVPIFNRAHNTVWEYIYTGRFESVSTQHAEVASMWIDIAKGVTPVINTTVRWSVFTHFEGTGGLIAEADGFYVYGNVFYKPVGGECSSSGNGLIGGWTNRIWKNVKIYSNSFIGTGVCATLPTIDGLAQRTGIDVKNNLFIQASVSMTNVNAWSYNQYVDLVKFTGTKHSSDVDGSSNPYPRYLYDDFSMSQATQAGITLAAPFNVDMYGNVRGVDGTWDRGAIEYLMISGPAAPTSLRIVR